jgi:tetratricopeptide (TPR) repeat protein
MWCLVLSAILFGSGCRSLRTSRHTRALTAARQLSLRGADHLQQGNYGEASPLFTEALRNSNADERAHWGLGECKWKEGSCQQATWHMARAAELSGNNPDLLVRLGEMYLAEGDLDRAMQQADLALDRERRHAQAWALRGQVLRQRGDLQQALECYDLALIHRPANPVARIAIAEIHYALGQPQRTLAAIEKLADQQPTDEMPARAWLLKGQALASLGEAGEAKQCLRYAAIRADESETQLLLDLAHLQWSSGDLAEARVCLGRALRNDPTDPTALNLKKTLNRSFDDYSRQLSQPLKPAVVSLVGKKTSSN